MIGSLKNLAVSLLERHPYGYALGLALMESTTFFLPHENDFYAMPLVADPSKSALFLDIGANRGHSALGFSKMMPGWRTISIEANPLHRARLESLKNRKKLFDYHIAAADTVTGNVVTIWTPRYGKIYCHSSSAVDHKEAVRSIELSFPAQAKNFTYEQDETTTLALDDLNLAPTIIKIDIQGKEVDCIRGLANTIRLYRPIFLIECNLDGGNIVTSMREHNYVSHVYDRSRHCLIKTEKALGIPQGRNVFFIPIEKSA